MTSIISHGMYGTGGRGPPRRRREPSRVTAAPCLQCYGAEVVASPAERRRRSATGRSGRQPAWSGAASSRRSATSKSLGLPALAPGPSHWPPDLVVRPRHRRDTHDVRLPPADLQRRPTSLAAGIAHGAAAACARTETGDVGQLALRFVGIRWPVALRVVHEASRWHLQSLVFNLNSDHFYTNSLEIE
jgi:hypothetical protein